MKFFTKLNLLLVTVTILPIIVITGLFYWQMRDAISSQINDQLVSLADSKKQEIDTIITSYFNILKLVSNRTSLKVNLQEYLKNKDEQSLANIKQILLDNSQSVAEIQSITLFNKDNEMVASTDPQINKSKGFWPIIKQPEGKEKLQGVFKDAGNIPRLLFSSPVIFDNKVIGFITVTSIIDPVIKITSNYIGLGSTGEMLIAEKKESGDALFITPTRFDPNASLVRVVSKDQINVPVITAIQGQELLLTEKNIVDYRNVPAIAVTRFSPLVDWGLVVKIDRAEAYQPLVSLFYAFLLIFVLTEILVFMISLVASRSLIKPLTRLLGATKQLTQTDFSSPVVVDGHYAKNDELGVLVKVFNEM
ncbi:MAG: HAMP domain-containing protein, partial [Candidatus Magasanikbacteria bacterium]|nr:HAMP domain-containing protein [Candidatus Magasanikbacteria bacterium]